jgi:hypothetical protein
MANLCLLNESGTVGKPSLAKGLDKTLINRGEVVRPDHNLPSWANFFIAM